MAETFNHNDIPKILLKEDGKMLPKLMCETV